MSKRLLTVLGTRPQIIKYAALFRYTHRRFAERVLDTGQHYDAALQSQLYEQLRIPRPSVCLDIRETDATTQIAKMLLGVSREIREHRPDLLLCIGDTNSTLAAALAGVKYDVPVAHLEAGERNFYPNGRKATLWANPEEANRVLTDRVSRFLLCASQQAVKNLASEAVEGQAFFTGDVMYDLFLENLDAYRANSAYPGRLGLEPGGYVFCTVHRAGNTDSPERLAAVVDVLESVELPIVFPLHPRTRQCLDRHGLTARFARIPHLRILDPLNHRDAVALLSQAHRIVSDSGGVLREGYFAGVFVVFLDQSTEWVDITSSGWAEVTGPDRDRVLTALKRPPPDVRGTPYGDGQAAKRVVETLERCVNSL